MKLKGSNIGSEARGFASVMQAGDEGHSTITRSIRALRDKLAPAAFVSGACEALRDYYERRIDACDAKVGDAKAIATEKNAARQRVYYWSRVFGHAIAGKFSRDKESGVWSFTANAPNAEKKARGANVRIGKGGIDVPTLDALYASNPTLVTLWARAIVASADAGEAIADVAESADDEAIAAAKAQAEAEAKAAEAKAAEAKRKAAKVATANADANAEAKLAIARMRAAAKSTKGPTIAKG